MTVTISGPLFSPSVGRIVSDAVRDINQDLVRRGEELLQDDLYPGHGYETGAFSRSVHGAVRESQHGVIYTTMPHIGAWLEGVSSLNDRTRYRGIQIFKQATQELDRDARRIGEDGAKRLVRRLS